MRIQAIREQRARVVADMRALTEKATQESRDLDDTEEARFNELKGDLLKLDRQLERAEVIAEAERSMEADPTQPRRGNDGSFEDLCRSFQITRAIAHAISPGDVDAAREHEISQELARRNGRQPRGFFIPREVFQTRAVTAGGSGGNLVPTAHRGDLFIDRLRESLRTVSLGATVLDGLVGDQEIPRLTGSATAYWVGEHEDVTASDHTFDTVSLSPKTVGTEVEYSRRMLLNAVPSVERMVRDDLLAQMAQAIEQAAITGDGTGNTPVGILNTAGIGSVDHGTNGGTTSREKLAEFNRGLAIANVPDSRLGWLTSPQLLWRLRTQQIVLDYPETVVESDQLLSHSILSSNKIPANYTKGTGTDLTGIILGNWSDLLIGFWNNFDILVNPYHSAVYSKGGVRINGFEDCDVAVRHPESFVAATDIDYTTTA